MYSLTHSLSLSHTHAHTLSLTLSLSLSLCLSLSLSLCRSLSLFLCLSLSVSLSFSFFLSFLFSLLGPIRIRFLQPVLSIAMFLAISHDAIPISFLSCSTVLRHVVLGLARLRFPSGCHVRAVLQWLFLSIRSTWPIHFHRLVLTSVLTRLVSVLGYIRFCILMFLFYSKCMGFFVCLSEPGGVLGSIFAGYVPLSSQNPYPVIVYSVAIYRAHLSHFWPRIVLVLNPCLLEFSYPRNPENVRSHSSNSTKNVTPSHYSQSTCENATPSSGTSPVAFY